MVGKDYAIGTYKKYKSCFKSLQSFLSWKYKSADFNINDIDLEFLTSYDFYLKSVQNIAHNTSMGYIKKVKKVVRQCLVNNWIDNYYGTIVYHIQSGKTSEALKSFCKST